MSTERTFYYLEKKKGTWKGEFLKIDKISNNVMFNSLLMKYSILNPILNSNKNWNN